MAKQGNKGDSSDASRKSDNAFDRGLKKMGMGDWTKPRQVKTKKKGSSKKKKK